MGKIIFLFLFIPAGIYVYLTWPQTATELIKPLTKSVQSPETRGVSFPSLFPSPSPILPPIIVPIAKTLTNDYHVFQTFNNCGPAAFSMTLSYYGINKTQQELGEDLRPYQVPGGDNDDKSVILEELAEKSKEYGLIPYHRPNGNAEIVKKFIASGFPVITRTWLKEGDDIGHYRVIKGYDETTGQFIQDDSLQGKNLRYSYEKFNNIWDKFNYEYLVLIPKDKQSLAAQILGEDVDEKTAWQKAVKLSQEILNQDPDDMTARFNLSVAYYHTGEYQKSVDEFEKVENQLPFRTLWYQIEPILSYYELGNYSKVFQITDKVLNYHNRAFSELYLIRGNIYIKHGDHTAARQEFEKAVTYNKNLKAAQNALASVTP